MDIVVLNDVGLTLEIFGFIVFLFIPISEKVGSYLLIKKSPKENTITDYLNNHNKLRFGVRGFGITMITFGLILQYSFLN